MAAANSAGLPVPRVYAEGIWHGRPVLHMSWMPGRPLRDELRAHRWHARALGVEFGLRAIRQAQGYMAAAEAAGLSRHQALDGVIRHKILPKMAFDAARPAGSGRARRDILVELRGELAKRFEGTDAGIATGSVAELDRMIRLAEGNNGIVNYWLR